MKKLFKTRKGNAVLDSLTVLVVIFVFGLLSLTVYHSFIEVEPSLTSEFNNSESLTVNESLASLDMVKDKFPNVFDAGMVMILIGLWAFALISAFFIDTHPIFFIFSVILLVFVFIASALIGNVGQELLSESEYTSVSGEFPITNWVLNHLLLVVMVIGFSVMVVLYGKQRG